MKIKVISDDHAYIYHDPDSGEIIYSIKIEDDYDLVFFMEKLKIIEVIKIIKLNPIELVVEKINFRSLFYKTEFVQNFKFINEPIKMIEIEDNKQKVEIKANVEFKLTLSYDFNYVIEKINQMMMYDNARFEKYKKAISDEKIQNASFDILNNYIENDPLKVVYGDDVMTLLKKGLMKVVF